MSRQAVSKWEADAAVPDTDKLIALSKLFGMSLNELLQVEGPPAAETPEGPVPRPWPGYRWLSAAAAVLLFALTAAALFQGFRLHALEEQIAALEEQVSPTALDPEKELVYDFVCTCSQGQSPDEMGYELELTPAQTPEGLEVTYLFTGEDGQVLADLPAVRYRDQYVLRGALGSQGEWEDGESVALSARFTDGRGGQLETELGRFTHSGPHRFGFDSLWSYSRLSE